MSEGAAKKTPFQCQSCVPPTAADFSGASVDVDANFVSLQSQLAKYVRSFNSQILLLRDELSRVKHTLDRAISRDISSIQDELNCVTQKIDSLQDLINLPDTSVNRPRTSVNYPRNSRRSLRNLHPYQSNRYVATPRQSNRFATPCPLDSSYNYSLLTLSNCYKSNSVSVIGRLIETLYPPYRAPDFYVREVLPRTVSPSFTIWNT